jgi:3-hydroxyisobutyrate dehydrogenase-like beta-hydroxyacid dehydrogenase
VASTPAEVIRECSVTFAMLADPPAALAVMEGPDGVASAMGPGKAYVDASTVDESTSQKIASMITEAGGRFLEAPVSGSKKPAIDGQLIFLAAGDESLFDECKPAFDVMGKEAIFLGDVGAGARMKLAVNMIMGTMMCALPSLSVLCDLSADVLCPYMRYIWGLCGALPYMCTLNRLACMHQRNDSMAYEA